MIRCQRTLNASLFNCSAILKRTQLVLTCPEFQSLTFHPPYEMSAMLNNFNSKFLNVFSVRVLLKLSLHKFLLKHLHNLIIVNMRPTVLLINMLQLLAMLLKLSFSRFSLLELL